jgi:hypothetical protein
MRRDTAGRIFSKTFLYDDLQRDEECERRHVDEKGLHMRHSLKEVELAQHLSELPDRDLQEVDKEFDRNVGQSCIKRLIGRLGLNHENRADPANQR